MVSQIVADVYAAGNTTTTSTNLQFPSGIAAGDDLWIFGLFAGIGNSAEAGGFTVPSGFTVYGSDHVYNATMAIRTWRKTAAGTETGSATCTWGGGSSASRTAWMVVAVPAANRTAGLVGLSFANAASGTTASLTAPSVTTSGEAMGFTATWERSSTASTALTATPSGTTVLDSSFGTSSGACSGAVARYNATDSDGSFGGGTWTWNSAANGGRVAATMAYNTPAPTNPPVTGTGTITLTGTAFAVEANRPVDLISYPAYGAHRGGPNTTGRPENVLYSFEQSILQDHPATILEFDLYQLGEGGGATATERLAVTHAGNDLSVGSQIRESDGTTVVTGTAVSKTVAQWDTYRVFPRTGISGSDRPATRWPAMRDLFLANPTKLGMAEAKDDASVAPLIETLAANNLGRRVMVQSFDWNRCVTMANAGLFVVYLVSQFTTRSAADIAAAGIKGVGVDRTDPSGYGITNICNEAHAAGMIVWAYTVNSTSIRDTLRSQGVDAFYTDVPRVVNRSATSGEATGTGDVALSGSATALESYSTTGNGVVALSGSATTSTVEIRSGSGSLALSGAATTLEREIATGQGSVTLSGSADATASGGTPSRTGLGTVTLTGAGTSLEREQSTGLGTTALTGTATAVAVVTGNGQVAVSGAAVTIARFTVTGSSVLDLAGSGASVSREFRAALGTLDLAGTADAIERHYATGLGALVVVGTAEAYAVTAGDGRPVGSPRASFGPPVYAGFTAPQYATIGA